MPEQRIPVISGAQNAEFQLFPVPELWIPVVSGAETVDSCRFRCRNGEFLRFPAPKQWIPVITGAETVNFSRLRLGTIRHRWGTDKIPPIGHKSAASTNEPVENPV